MPKTTIVIAIIVILGLFGYLIFQSGSKPEEQKEIEPEQKPEISSEKALKNLFAEKYNKDVSEITINISQETENHLRGGVIFQPGGSENSGRFLAAKENDEWNLIYDGQGAIFCSVIEPYNFPTDMVDECINNDGKVEKREKVQLANPASVYCIEQAGTLEIRTDETGGQSGFCIFEDGSECEEWAFFRKECEKGEKICKDLCGDGTCQEVVCLAVGCPCSETAETCPQDCE